MVFSETCFRFLDKLTLGDILPEKNQTNENNLFYNISDSN